MPATLNPVSQLPNGVIATTDALALVDVSSMGENATVLTLGRSSVNDGGGGAFAFVAGSSATVDNALVVATPTTGRWIGSVVFSGVGPVTVDRTGYRETFAILSGFAPVVYALPPASAMAGKAIKVITATTGTVTVRTATPTEFIYSNGTVGASITATLTGGWAANLQVFNGQYYRTDTRFGL